MRCAHCGRKLKEPWVYSRFTGARYCGTDLKRCEALGAKRIRKEKGRRKAAPTPVIHTASGSRSLR